MTAKTSKIDMSTLGAIDALTAKPARKTRQRVVPFAPSADQIREGEKAIKARKAASRKALKASKAAPTEIVAAAQPTEAEMALTELKAHASNLKALKAEMDATGMSLEEAAESMGVNPETGAPVEPEGKRRYDGPMLALVAARKAYTKAANGVLCNGSPLAMLCGQYSRPVVVAALVDALKLPGNPYLQLNPGQQSMNLRNKARHQISAGFLSMGEIEAHLKAHAARLLCSN